MKNLFPAVALASVLGLGSASAFNVITGSVTEFSDTGDLNLSSTLAVIAVDSFGNGDSTVNGVTFFTDRAGLGAGVTAEGVVSSGGVTVTTGLVNQIDGWATPPIYTGADNAALSAIMQDIRWANAGAGQVVDVGVSGLAPNTLYNVQLLFNEGADRNRRWDIGVNGTLVVDDFSSEGAGVWSPTNGFAYSGNFNSGAGGVLDIIMGADPFPGDPNNALGPQPTDNNAILQGVIISQIPEPSASALLGLGMLALVARRRRRG